MPAVIQYHHLILYVSDACELPALCSFFRRTPDGSRQVVYQAGKTIAF